MIIKTIPQNAQEVKAAVEGRIMHSDERVQAILLTLKPGESIPLHQNRFDVLFAGVEGTATFVTPSTQMTIEPGETIFVTSKEERAWKNSGNSLARIMVFKILR